MVFSDDITAQHNDEHNTNDKNTPLYHQRTRSELSQRHTKHSEPTSDLNMNRLRRPYRCVMVRVAASDEEVAGRG